tara:strand:+ start:3635 stop:4513 length:879 start_codon:yes stop_codon:yes gene_type:complete
MNLNYLECFVSLSETMSFTETAKEFSVSQPSISRQIRLLEEQLNQKLFIRDKHKVHLTEAGMELKTRLRPLMKELKNVISSAQEDADNLKGTLHVGCLGEVGQHAVMRSILDFHQQNPGVDIETQFLSPNLIIDKIKLGQLDFGIIGQEIDLENVRAYKLMEERCVLVTRASNEKIIEDINQMSFVTYTHHDVLLVDYLHHFYKRIPYGKIKKPISVNSHRSMVEALFENDYYAIIPYFSVEKEIQSGKLKIVSDKEITNQLYLIYMENSLMPLKNELFRKHIMAWAKTKSL